MESDIVGDTESNHLAAIEAILRRRLFTGFSCRKACRIIRMRAAV
jgi:hypothetical protein